MFIPLCKSIVLVGPLLSVVSQEGAGRVRPRAEALEAVRTALRARVENGTVASIAVAVGRGGEPLWVEAFGQADRERGLAATADTPYPVASLTKSMTATAAVILADRGQLDLDAPVSVYLGEDALSVHAGAAADVTLRAVLSMTAGIPHGWLSYAPNATVPAMHAVLRDVVIVAFPPGEEFLYSNYAYALPEVAIERVSGSSFADFMQAALFRPLGMTHSFVEPVPAQARVAASYDGAGTRIGTGRFQPAGAAGAYASARDLLRYGFFHLGAVRTEPPVLSAAGLRAMHGPAGGGGGYLGFAHSELEGGPAWWISNGQFSGCSSMLMLLPEQELVIAVLVNQGGASPSTADTLAVAIADALVPGFASRHDAFLRTWEAEHALAAYAASPELLGTWSGRIETAARSVPFTLTLEDDGSIWATWDDAHEADVTGVRRRGPRLTMSLRLALPNPVGFAGEHSVELDLRVDGERMSGSATSRFAASAGSFSIPAYVALERGDG